MNLVNNSKKMELYIYKIRFLGKFVEKPYFIKSPIHG